VRLEDVSVRFRLPRERILSFKEYAIHWLRRRIRYEDFWALRGVSLEVGHGEVFGIIGANGAGKSTLLKVLAGVFRPTEGRVRVWGKLAPLIDLGAGFEHELTGRENAVMNGTILGYSKAESEARLARSVAFAELEEFIDAPLRTYSSGMIARLAFAVATDVEPDVLIVDEVLSVGDAAFQKKSFERIQAFRTQGVTILLVSHDMAAISSMCNRVAWLDHGRVREVGPPSEVLPRYQQTPA
jgi:ABC-2 type transport system ATP-binding protein/lipopolysaccharide transport system ATP-binding protein